MTTVANGLRILVEELPHTHSVSLGYFTGVGAGYESPALSGAAHFIEHMCFKGTRTFPTARIISDTIEGVGGMLNASTSYESTVYSAKVADIHMDRALMVLTEMLRYPLFDPRELEKERRVILEEIRGSQDDPDEWVHALLHAAMWGDQPLGRDIAGTLDSVSAISRSDLLAFWNAHYHPHNIVISIAGHIQTDQAVAAVLQACELPADTAITRHDPVARSVGTMSCQQAQPWSKPPLPGPQVTLVPRVTEQGHFCLGMPALSYRDADRRALQVLDTIVGSGMSSRLFQTLREDMGVAYHVGSYQIELADGGMWVLYGGVEDDTLSTSVGAMLQILHNVVTEGVTDEELTRVKEQVKGGMLLSLEDTWSIAARNGAHQLRYNGVIPVEQVVAEIEAVTRADVLRVARRLLRRDAMHLAVIGPYDTKDEQTLATMLHAALE